MPKTLLVEITTPDCKEGETYQYTFPVDKDRVQILSAVEVFYPDYTAVTMEEQEEENE